MLSAALLGAATALAAQPMPSGLEPSFNDAVRCAGIASPFGSPTRHDGSARPPMEFGGRHGGIDITLPEGTPVLAIANGTVATKGEGGMMEGVFLWLRHSPDDTGLRYWLYSKYQHLESIPTLALGDRVAVGQAIARSGKTGTVGRHFGSAGYAHLHLTTGAASSGDALVGSRGESQGLRLIDPLVAYRDAAKATADRVPIAHVAAGIALPAGTRMVWPIACEASR